MSAAHEPDAVRARYARRDKSDDRYSLLNPAALCEWQGRQRALAKGFVRHGYANLTQLRLTEVGCGSGGNLLELLRLGFTAEHLHGIELLPERHAAARRVLPEATTLWLGDAAAAPLAQGSQQLLLVSTVFSSLLDDAFQERLAQTMWSWLAPGGTVIWYDFTVDNPRNRDVRGVPLKRVKALFPQAAVDAQRLTLAPPLARAVCRVHPSLYAALNVLPLLRTHLLVWLTKPE